MRSSLDDRIRLLDEKLAAVTSSLDMHSQAIGARRPEDDEDEERERRYEADEDAAKPDFGLSGALAKDENTGNVYKGHVLKWTEPDDARKPVDRWRIYEYKNGEQVKILHIHRQSAFLIGRIKDIADILTMHPSCSGPVSYTHLRAHET